MEALIAAKLFRLKGYVGYLRSLRPASLRAFEEDFKTRGAAERYLQLAIESIIDIGNQIIAAMQWRRPEAYRDVPLILSENGVIPPDFANEISKMIGFRNLLVHDYAALDISLEHEFLETKLDDFEEYMKHVADWLKANRTKAE